MAEIKKNLKVHFSSLKIDYRTPETIYNELNQEFKFDFDPCPAHNNSLMLFDGLGSDWGESNFVNPPYGNEIGKWIKKGYEEAQKGKNVIFLIPSRTDTRWWHEYVMKAQEIRFVKGRISFNGKGPAPFPSCVEIFRPITAQDGNK